MLRQPLQEVFWLPFEMEYYFATDKFINKDESVQGFLKKEDILKKPRYILTLYHYGFNKITVYAQIHKRVLFSVAKFNNKNKASR